MSKRGWSRGRCPTVGVRRADAPGRPPAGRCSGIRVARRASVPARIGWQGSGQRFTSRRVPAADAWTWTEIEYGRTPTSYAAVLGDLDGDDSGDRLDGAVLARAVQPPSWAVVRPSSGGVHAVWALVTPVHRYPHAKRGPLEFFARVSEYYATELRADPGYRGVLAHNPISGSFKTRFMHAGGWTLDEVADPIPADWRRPSRRKLISAAGRNVTLFMSLCRFAGNLSRLEYDIEVGRDFSSRQTSVLSQKKPCTLAIVLVRCRPCREHATTNR